MHYLSMLATEKVSGLTANQILVLVDLARGADQETGANRLSKNEMHRRIMLAPKTIFLCIKALVEKGLVLKVARVDQKTKMDLSNEYYLICCASIAKKCVDRGLMESPKKEENTYLSVSHENNPPMSPQPTPPMSPQPTSIKEHPKDLQQLQHQIEEYNAAPKKLAASRVSSSSRRSKGEGFYSLFSKGTSTSEKLNKIVNNNFFKFHIDKILEDTIPARPDRDISLDITSEIPNSEDQSKAIEIASKYSDTEPIFVSRVKLIKAADSLIYFLSPDELANVLDNGLDTLKLILESKEIVTKINTRLLKRLRVSPSTHAIFDLDEAPRVFTVYGVFELLKLGVERWAAACLQVVKIPDNPVRNFDTLCTDEKNPPFIEFVKMWNYFVKLAGLACDEVSEIFKPNSTCERHFHIRWRDSLWRENLLYTLSKMFTNPYFRGESQGADSPISIDRFLTNSKIVATYADKGGEAYVFEDSKMKAPVSVMRY